jgi:geranylgeranyl reductase family protein
LTATDVLVVGGGPAGASTALRLAGAGHDVTVVERGRPSRRKSCGDALSPRALRELADLDVDPLTLDAHRVEGIRFLHGDRSMALPWPATEGFPDHGAVLRRSELDEHLRGRATAAGARVLYGHEATAPVVERGFVRGAHVSVAGHGSTVIRSRFLVVADGANSRFGRALGTTRQRAWPYGVATRTYFSSPRSGEDWMEVSLGPPDPSGNAITGFGWVNPVGDGTVNVGIGMLSTYRDVMGVNAINLLRSFAEAIAERWELDPGAMLDAPARARVPLGGSVGPRMGPTFLVTGDAGGLAHPLTGDGVQAALASGRIAATVLGEALASGSSTSLQRFPTALADEVDHPHVVGRLAARFLGRPAVLGPALWLGMRSERVLGGALRVATNELRPDRHGGAERADRIARFVARFAPRW